MGGYSPNPPCHNVHVNPCRLKILHEKNDIPSKNTAVIILKVCMAVVIAPKDFITHRKLYKKY